MEKGSTVNFCSSILKSNGYNVGKYTSPNIGELNERIQINDKPITDSEIFEIIDEIKDVIKKYKPSFFELITTICFLYFKKKNIDVGVIEVGMGGKFDATNVVQKSISAITNISKDHTEYLGESIEEIAEEKSGIIKPDSIFITSEKNPKILDIFRRKCKNSRTVFKTIDEYLIDDGFVYNDTKYKIKMKGQHQIENACLAIEISKAFCDTKNFSAIEDVYFEGRLEWRNNILLDSAHNSAGVDSLCAYLEDKDFSFVGLIGFSKNKDISYMGKNISKFCSKIIVTSPSFKPEIKEKVIKSLEKNKIEFVFIDDSEEALTKALKHEGKILVTGSLYLVSDITRILNQTNN